MTGVAGGGGGASLTVQALARRFPGGERPAVDDVSFELRAGELLALVGASGSGKTTTLRMIAGYELPDGGRVLVADANGKNEEITRLAPQRRNFGMVFQHYALFPHMSVEENVAFGLEARGVDRRTRIARAHAALDRVGLAGAGLRAVQSLSGGEQQRVALARALVIEPRVLLLDEPLSNLDPALRQSTREQLRAMLHALHVTAVFVTHDQEDAFAIADRVAMLHRGRLMQIGTPEELYRRPSSVEVARFIGRGALLPARDADERVRITVGGIAQDAPIASRPGGAGMDMVAVVRPESLRLTPSGTHGTWPARIRGRRFAAGHFAYQVELDALAGTLLEIVSDEERDAGDAAAGVRLADQPLALVHPST
jgi:ABC-type Fe3+/spermidine/putrescine transport system ATPase subunit